MKDDIVTEFVCCVIGIIFLTGLVSIVYWAFRLVALFLNRS